MGSIAKRINSKGEVTFQAKVRKQGFPGKTATFKRKSDADRWIKKVESDILEGKFFPSEKAKKISLSEVVDRYIREILPRKPKSAKDYTQQLSHWKKVIGHLSLSDVTSSVISQERQKLLQGKTNRGLRTPATVNRYMSTLILIIM